MPEVSIVMIVYNQYKDWLLQCLDSLNAQTYKDIEIIVSGVKGDQCLDWAKVYTDKIVENHYPDAKEQINNGIKFAGGNYIMVVGSDDYYYPRSVEWMVKTAETKNSVLVYSDLHYADDKLNIVFTWRAPSKFDMSKLMQLQFMHDSSLVKKSVLWEFGLYKPEWKKFAVWDMWLEIARKYPNQIHHCGHIIAKYRRHEKALGIRAFRGDLEGTGENLREKFYTEKGIKPRYRTSFVSNCIVTDYDFVEISLDKSQCPIVK